VTCHGWSYSGGAIGGAIYPGLRGLAGTDPETIRERLTAPDHPFPAEVLPDLGLDLLAFFIRDGLYDRADFIDDMGRAVGNPEFGRDIFEGACINCHQLDGRAYLRGEHGDRSSLGWVARNRPEQALHKMMNGVPAAEMLSLTFLSSDQIADLFAYLQSVDPAEKWDGAEPCVWAIVVAGLLAFAVASGSASAQPRMRDPAEDERLAKVWCASCDLVGPRAHGRNNRSSTIPKLSLRLPRHSDAKRKWAATPTRRIQARNRVAENSPIPPLAAPSDHDDARSQEARRQGDRWCPA
jgi:mono/diheme cytochrome c family protein